MKETFVDILGYEGLYKVSNFGRVYSTKRNKCLKPGELKSGYLVVVLCKDAVTKTIRVHRLVAEAFVPNPNNLPQVNHIDEDKTNNAAYNLEWCTASYNRRYSAHKTNKPVAQLANGKVISIYKSVNEASRVAGISCAAICNCCNNKPNFKTAGGYTWRYLNGEQ